MIRLRWLLKPHESGAAAILIDAPGVRVNVESVGANEARKGNPESVGEFDGQARGCSDGSDDWDARCHRFLNELEACSPAQHRDVLVEWEPVVLKGPTNQLVHGVVSADVFSQRHKGAVRLEEPHGVQPSGTREERLVLSERVGKRAEHLA